MWASKIEVGSAISAIRRRASHLIWLRKHCAAMLTKVAISLVFCRTSVFEFFNTTGVSGSRSVVRLPVWAQKRSIPWPNTYKLA
jgi:hypothetical protein